MNSKWMTVIVLILLMALGAGYLKSAIALNEGGDSSTIGAGYFPILLATILLILCMISLIKTVIAKGKTEKIEIPNARLILLTIVFTALFILGWSYIGYFFVNLFLFLFLCITTYRFQGFKGSILLKNGAVSLVLVGLIYLIFDVALSINF